MKILLLFPVAAMLLVATACEHPTKAANSPKPLDVLVAAVQRKDVPLYREWIGSLDGLVNAEIKAQVSGYLIKQEYAEGSFVRQGQLLFQIDPRPFQAELDQAEGRLPSDVTNYGVTVQKSVLAPLMVIALNSPKSTYDARFLANYAYINLVDQLTRVKGVGTVQVRPSRVDRYRCSELHSGA